ncbi:type IV pilin [Halobacteriales archaeon QS_3_64_16]|nr:MAG: type IV pilin [Halobacteriales archaeon QS_3_64_16]
MNLKAKLQSVFGGEDERAVSPVIGVILMVAITVILAAVIAVFVTDLGGSQSQAPQASFSIEGASGGVTVTHTGGETINSDNIVFQGAGTGGTTWTTVNGNTTDVSAGTSVDPPASGTGTLRIIWNDPSSDQTATLATYEVE